MAANARGNASGRRQMPVSSSSLDQQQQHQSGQQQVVGRRSSASNFDQLTGQLIRQYNQQQIENAAAQKNPQSTLLMSEPSKCSSSQVNSRSSTVSQLGHEQNDYVNYYYQQETQTALSASNNNNSSNTEKQVAQSRPARNGKHNQIANSQQRLAGVGGTQITTMAPYVKDDIDVMFSRLMALEAFRKLHPSVIRNLCSYAFIERVDKGVIGEYCYYYYYYYCSLAAICCWPRRRRRAAVCEQLIDFGQFVQFHRRAEYKSP